MLEEVLGREPDIRLVGSVGDAATALQMIRDHEPNVVTIDIAMPGPDGLSLLDKVHGHTHTVMLTSRAEAAEDCFDRGALGFFHKAHILTDSKKLVKMVREAAGGRRSKAA